MLVGWVFIAPHCSPKFSFAFLWMQSSPHRPLKVLWLTRLKQTKQNRKYNKANKQNLFLTGVMIKTGLWWGPQAGVRAGGASVPVSLQLLPRALELYGSLCLWPLGPSGVLLVLAAAQPRRAEQPLSYPELFLLKSLGVFTFRKFFVFFFSHSLLLFKHVRKSCFCFGGKRVLFK